MFAVGLPNRQGLTNGHQEIRALQLHLDELRGGMDASEYKDYVLVLLFVKYVSDKYAGQKDAMLDVAKGGSFADMVALQGDKEIGDKIRWTASPTSWAFSISRPLPGLSSSLKSVRSMTPLSPLASASLAMILLINSPDLHFWGNRADGDDLLGEVHADGRDRKERCEAHRVSETGRMGQGPTRRQHSGRLTFWRTARTSQR